jgi:hypothetical protein
MQFGNLLPQWNRDILEDLFVLTGLKLSACYGAIVPSHALLAAPLFLTPNAFFLPWHRPTRDKNWLLHPGSTCGPKFMDASAGSVVRQ